MTKTIALAVLLMMTAVQAQPTIYAGGYPGTQNLHGMIVRSTNGGKTWHEVYFADEPQNTINDMVYAKDKGMLVAVGRGGIVTSKDGKHWVKRGQAVPGLRPLHSVAYGDGMFVAVGAGSNIQYSTNGETWKHVYKRDAKPKAQLKARKAWSENVFGTPNFMHYLDVTFLNGEFLVTGTFDRLLKLKNNAGKLAYVSDLRQTSKPFDQARGIITDNKNTVVILSNNRNYLSVDKGASLKRLRGLKKNVGLVTGVYTGKSFIAAGRFGAFFTSKDGHQWQRQQRVNSRGIQDLAYGDGVAYAVNKSQALLSSLDNGVSWKSLVGNLVDVGEDYNMSFLSVLYVDH